MASNPAYTTQRDDLLSLASHATRALDVGCAEGANGRALKARFPDVTVTGIELDPAMAARARSVLDEVLEGDAVGALERLRERDARYDLVLLGDVLEHLADPWHALGLVRALCPPGGAVIVSLPNVAHWSTLWTLAVKQHWPYRSRGIHDRTHLRFFARKNLAELFEQAGFRLDTMRTRYRVTEHPSWINGPSEPVLARLVGLRRPFAYQFICRLV